MADPHRQGCQVPYTPYLSGIRAWQRVEPVLTELRANGFSALVVGGAVRDLLLGETPGDVDILTDARPDDIERIFGKVRRVGNTFAVSRVGGVEVASCRAALAGTAESRFPEEDLGFRDFTVNSMAWDPAARTLTDPFGGRKDLSRRIIRFTRDPRSRILEDPLRMVRAARFAARYGGVIEKESLDAIVAHGDLIGAVAQERLRTELLKAMTMARPSLFFEHLQAAGLLARILPSLSRCHGLDGGPFHGETVFEHCMLVGDALPANRPVFRLAGFLHDVGKFDAAAVKEGRLTFAGHETETYALETDLDTLRFSARERSYILALVRAHMRPLTHETTPRAVRRLLAMLNDLHLDYRDFLRMRIADKKGNRTKAPYTLSELKVRIRKIRDELAGPSAFGIDDIAISGREICLLLRIPPGPEVGRIKRALFDKVLKDPSLNTRDRLAAEVLTLGGRPPSPPGGKKALQG